MLYIYSTQKWIKEVVREMNKRQLKAEDSRFMIAFFSSLDNEFIEYLGSNKHRISSFSGKNFHIFTPQIYEDKSIPDDEWRDMRREFKSMGIPIDTDPTFIFFNLESKNGQEYEPYFFAGFKLTSFSDFPNKLKVIIDNCIEIKDVNDLNIMLSQSFSSKSIVSDKLINKEFKRTISNEIPKSKLFISHSSFDKPFAHKLINALANDSSINVWIDEKEILTGADIQKSITENLRTSDLLLLIISENSVKSSWVNFEIAQYMVIAGNENIIPIIISKDQNFDEPIDNLLRRLKYIDFTKDESWNRNIEELKLMILNRQHN